MNGIKLYRRPNQKIIDEVVELIKMLTDDWFTENVPEDTRKDLLFQDLICYKINSKIRSFLVFTSFTKSMDFE